MGQPRQPRVAVMGIGWVGGAVARYFKDCGREPILFDPPKGLGTTEELAEADVVFVCVPTPFDARAGGFDLSFVDRAVESLPDGKIVVVKSTVLPGTTEDLQRRYPRQRFLFNPEFLREKTADADFREPERQIVGVTGRSVADAETVLGILPKAPFIRVVRATEAETVKYFGNCFLALKVVFANQLFDVCGKLGIDYDVVKSCAAADSRIGASHLDVRLDGYRGYAGSCFPKDVRAFIQLGDTIGAPVDLLKACEDINNRLIGAKDRAVAESGSGASASSR